MSAPHLLVVAFAALVSTIAGGSTVTAQTTSAPAKSPSVGPSAAAMPEMEFYLAHGAANACGRGCSEWIAAEGKIDSGTAQRLRRLLAKLGRARPPIYFHSPGGSIVGALELGRLIRDQKLEASVAHTISPGCRGDKPPEKPCETQGRSAQGLASEFDTTVSMCNSACVYALAGGTVRLVPPGVKLGIHDVGFDPAMTPPRGARLGEVKRIAHERIQEYLREMGMDDALFRAASAVPFESKKFLERDELARFGIDRREFGETGWRFVDKPLPEMSKIFFVRTDNDQHRYVDGFVSVGCGVGQTIRLTLARQHVASEATAAGPRPFSLSVNGRRIELSNQMSSLWQLDIRSAWPSTNTFEAVDDNATLELSRVDLARNDESAGGMPLSMAGFSAQYAKLRKSCDDAARNVAAVVLPANPTPYVDTKTLGTLSPPAVHWPAGLKDPAPVPPAAAPAPAQPASNATDPPSRSGPGQLGCGLQVSDVPLHVTGRVTGFLSDEEASARTRRIEAQLGARINSTYISLRRATVEIYSEGNWFATAAIPESMAVRIGDLVELDSRYGDQAPSCHFIPWTIDRLVVTLNSSVGIPPAFTRTRYSCRVGDPFPGRGPRQAMRPLTAQCSGIFPRRIAVGWM
jgi:hypothetical protein